MISWRSLCHPPTHPIAFPVIKSAVPTDATQPVTLSNRIKDHARELGFDQVGISRVAHDGRDQPGKRLHEWLNRGYHGTMNWMPRTAQKRADITEVFPDVRSVVSVAVNYYTNYVPDETNGNGRIARYAWGDDYHFMMDSRLTAFAAWIEEEAARGGTRCETRTYIDTGPILEKAWAQQAGIGWIGKHSNLVSTTHGSWLILGEVLVSLDLQEDEPTPDQCGSCQLCIDICPTQAIPEPYVLDATKCIAYLTIEYRGPIPQTFHADIGNRIFGCDDCLDICPYNHNAVPSTEAAFQPRPIALKTDLRELTDQSTIEFQTMFKNSPVKRAKHEGLQRNVDIAGSNAHPSTSLHAAITPKRTG